MTYFPALRRTYILWRLAHCGEVSRPDVARTFGVSVSIATQDIAAVLQDYHSVNYCKTRRRYRAGHEFGPPDHKFTKMAEALGWS